MEWLEEQIGDYAEDYLIIDCPGGLLPVVLPSTK
jgi:MinD-like ATPase involved in chromosome partitioning or flagellar assembly